MPEGSQEESLDDLPAQTADEQLRSRIFLDFNYPELKDLGKNFLTISPATIAFFLTFIERIIGPASATSALVKTSIALLIVSVATVGTGLCIAGSGSTRKPVWGIGKNFRLFAPLTCLLYLAAGAALLSAYAGLRYFSLRK